MADADPLWRDAGFSEFYDRHKSYLWTVCEDVASSYQCDAWAEDVFAETFQVAYQKAATFGFQSCPAEEEDNVVKAWLGRIARNRMHSRWRKCRLETTRSDEEWEKIAGTSDAAAVGTYDAQDAKPEALTAATDQEDQLMEEAMEQLTDREAHVLRITSQFHRPGKIHQRLPNSVMDELADSLGTTSENIRKIRERAKRKVRQYMDDNRRKDTP